MSWNGRPFASNLAPGDTNGVADIFLRDRDTDGDGVFDEAGAVSTARVSQVGTVQANGPSFHPVATVVVRSLPEGPFLPAVSSEPLVIPGHARLTVPMSALPGFSRGAIEVVEGGTPTHALVVEGAMYWNAGGRLFGAGANWPATRIP